jgi:alginate O-acetyltransferase complex protein AlgI
MAFNSIHFMLFLPVVLALYWTLRRNAVLRIAFLLLASYYFYMSWNVLYAGLILGSTVLDYFAALGMQRWDRQAVRRGLLVTSLVGNLGVLFVFKYYNFFVDNVSAVFGFSHGATEAAHHSLLLPVGISFYTFQTLSYTIDVYRRKIEPTRNFLKFALFVSFFPQLVAGPIVRASHFLPPLQRKPFFDDRKAENGLGQVLLGLFKKICIADVLGVTIVDPVFADPAACSSWALAVAMYGYAFQIYYDFCGYSDIAIGVGKMLGFDLPINFNRPYLATSMRSFWRRWHISLSTWLRDYLYISLGGGKGSPWKTARNLAIVMLLGGLWHGAAWGFVIWGAIHGLLLGAGRVFHHFTGIDADREGQPTVSRIARIIVTFHLAAGCFVVFRSTSLETLTAYWSTMCSLTPGAEPIKSLGYLALLTAAAIEWAPRRWLLATAQTYFRIPSYAQACVVAGSLLVFAALGGTSAPFIYFQF